MGATGVRVTEYDQTKAMENADLIIANCFANGRAVDDNVAVIFDVTKLEEYGSTITDRFSAYKARIFQRLLRCTFHLTKSVEILSQKSE